MNPNYDKEALGSTLSSRVGTPSGSTCFDYGSVSGCDSGCPALLRGECEVFADVIEQIEPDLSPEEIQEIKLLYKEETGMQNEDEFFNMLRKRLKYFRAAAGITQAVLGEPAGVDRRYVAKVECGSQHPSFGFLRKISSYHNISINWLCYGQGSMFLEKAVNRKWHKKVEVA
ncbi:MAG: helix-turn-helix transcriptional regulator [bacterium]|nr:helix-turn-helix transcriptional regulator [bacterium]